MKQITFISSLLVMLAFSSAAQPFTMNPDIVPTELNMYPYKPLGKPNQEGRMNVTSITQQKDTLYFFAKGFSIYSPGYIGISCEDKSNELEVALFTENWLKPVQSGNTADSGHWEKRFKNEGDFGIRIIAKTKPSKYSIVIWNGKDVEIDVPTPFVYKTDTGSSGNFFTKNWMYLAIGVLLIAVIFLLLKRKKN